MEDYDENRGEVTDDDREEFHFVHTIRDFVHLVEDYGIDMVEQELREYVKTRNNASNWGL